MNTLTSIVYAVTDLRAAKAIQTVLLGTDPHTDTPYYVGFNVGGVEIGLTTKDPKTATMVAYVHVPDLEAALTEVLSAGATLASKPHDVGGGTRIATVTDADGNTLGLITRS